MRITLVEAIKTEYEGSQWGKALELGRRTALQLLPVRATCRSPELWGRKRKDGRDTTRGVPWRK